MLDPQITTVLFDLDGTLLPMEVEHFTKTYFGLLAQKAAPYGFAPEPLVAAVWKGTKAMVKNDGTMTNDRRFWEVFCQATGGEESLLRPVFDGFYQQEFHGAKAACGENPLAKQAVERLGMPEARIVLAQAVTYMASAPKSNSAINAIDKAMRVVQETKTPPVPVHLQDAHYKSAGKLGHGKGYKYAHDYKNHYVKQQYLPDGLTGEVFYEPSENGYEQQIRAYYKKIKENPEE